jgi:hypothetical protein
MLISIALMALALLLPTPTSAQYSGADLDFWNGYLEILYQNNPPYEFTEIADVRYVYDELGTVTDMQVAFKGSDGDYHVLSTVVQGSDGRRCLLSTFFPKNFWKRALGWGESTAGARRVKSAAPPTVLQAALV